MLIAAADDAAWASPVQACGAWTLRELVAHLGGVHRMAIQAISEGTKSWSHHHPPPEGVDLGQWFRDGAAELLRALDADPGREAWSFVPGSGSVGFWQRRQAMENLVHRVDAELAMSARTPIDPGIAADGVAEVLDTLLPLRAAKDGPERAPRSLTLYANDVGRHFPLGAPQDSTSVDIGGPSADVLLALWHRIPPEELETLTPAGADFLRGQLTP